MRVKNLYIAKRCNSMNPFWFSTGFCVLSWPFKCLVIRRLFEHHPLRCHRNHWRLASGIVPKSCIWRSRLQEPVPQWYWDDFSKLLPICQSTRTILNYKEYIWFHLLVSPWNMPQYATDRFSWGFWTKSFSEGRCPASNLQVWWLSTCGLGQLHCRSPTCQIGKRSYGHSVSDLAAGCNKVEQ